MRLTPRGIIYLGLGIASLAVFFLFVPPIPQNQAYHEFADTRAFGGIPNFCNVASNVPFGLFGIVDLCTSLYRPWLAAASPVLSVRT